MRANHHRRSIRLREWDYRSDGAYFVTICTHERECLLGEVHDGAMALSPYGCVVQSCWLSLPDHFAGAELDAFVVMPNHAHAIVILFGRGKAFGGELEGPASMAGSPPNALPLQKRGAISGSLAAIVQSRKSVSARRINQLRDTPGAPVWQRNYYEHIIRNARELDAIRQYIDANPANWELDSDNPRRQCHGRTP
jgi:REP element-mobilizing transposase RayT